MSIEGMSWSPEWPGGPIGQYQVSSTLSKLPFSIPRTDCRATIRSTRSRGDLSIAEVPSAANDYRLVVRFDDSAELGAITYDITIEVVPDE